VVDQSGGGVGWPCWAPDGSFIAFALQTGAKLELCTVKPDGTGFTRVLSKDGMNFSQPVLLQRDVWACLKSARGNTLIDQSIVMGSRADEWSIEVEYELPGLLISSLRSHPAHGALVFTARVDSRHAGPNVFTSETDPLQDHAFLVDMALGVGDLGRGADPCFTGDGSHILFAKRMDAPDWGVRVVRLGTSDPNRVLTYLSAPQVIDREPSGSV
jgi:hypothetical protein